MKTDISEITIYSCSFTIVENITCHFIKCWVDVMYFILFYFYFYFVLRSMIFSEKVRKPTNKKEKT